MHTGPMKESDGKFDGERPAMNCKCGKCGSTDVVYRTWESSDGGYEDAFGRFVSINNEES